MNAERSAGTPSGSAAARPSTWGIRRSQLSFSCDRIPPFHVKPRLSPSGPKNVAAVDRWAESCKAPHMANLPFAIGFFITHRRARLFTVTVGLAALYRVLS